MKKYVVIHLHNSLDVILSFQYFKRLWMNYKERFEDENKHYFVSVVWIVTYLKATYRDDCFALSIIIHLNWGYDADCT